MSSWDATLRTPSPLFCVPWHAPLRCMLRLLHAGAPPSSACRSTLPFCVPLLLRAVAPSPSACHGQLPTLCPSLSIVMALKPASTAGKAPASSSTTSKAPAKTTEGSRAAKTTSKMAVATASGDDTKKRCKARKETYSSYIYKCLRMHCHRRVETRRILQEVYHLVS